MEEKKINNTFKLILIVAVLVVAISIVYYFILFLPQKEYQERSIKCQSIASKIYNDEIEENEISRKDHTISYNRPEFHYNKRTKQCLLYGSRSNIWGEEPNPTRIEMRFIKDVYSNIYLVRQVFYTNDPSRENSCSICVSREEFKRIKEELFEQ